MKSRVWSDEMVMTFLFRTISSLCSMWNSLVFFSHLCHRPFEWEQWVPLPWTLFHWSQDKKESWKEEARPTQSQRQQEQHKATDSFSPSPLTWGKYLLLLQEGQNGEIFTIHSHLFVLWTFKGKIWMIRDLHFVSIVHDQCWKQSLSDYHCSCN